MDAASLPQRDTRRCARPGCADVASATLSFRYDLSQAWVLPLTEEPSPATYDLCGPCADRTKPPRGWHLVDERPDLDAASAAPKEHDVVRAAIAAALRGQNAPLEVVPEPSTTPGPSAAAAAPAPQAGPATSSTTTAAPEAKVAPEPVLRAVPDAPRTPTVAPTPLADRLGQVPLTVSRVPSPPLAVRERPRPTERRRPVEVLIQPVVDLPVANVVADVATGPGPAEAPAATVAGDDDLVAALREHQVDQGAAAAEPAEPGLASPIAVDVEAKQDAARPFPDGSFDMHPVQAAAMELLVGEGRAEPTLDHPAAPAAAAAPASPYAEAVAMPLAFDETPDRFVSLGLDDLGEFTEDDLVAGLREDDRPSD